MEGVFVANLAPTDYLIFLLYFFFVLAIGISLRPLLTGRVDFLQAGRTLPAWICGLAMTTASLGSQDLIGLGAAGARYGFASIPFYLLGAIPAMLFSGLFLVPIYYRSEARTIPEYLAFRFGQKARLLNACLFAGMAVFGAGISLYAMGRVFSALHLFEAPLRATGMGPQGVLILSMALPAALVLAGLLLGGLTGTIYGLVMQFFMIVAGLFPVVFLGLKQIGGWKGLWAAAGLSTFAQNSGKNAHIGFVTLAASTAMGLIISAGTWCADFRVLQAAMAAKDVEAARRAPLIAAAVRIAVPFLLILPAIIALGMPTPRTTIVIHNDNGTIYHDISVVPPAVEQGQGLVPARTEETSEKLLKDPAGHVVLDYALALPNMLTHFLPAGLLGLGIASLLASMMAGAAASLTAFGTVFVCDLYEPLRHRENGCENPIVAMRWSVLVGMLLAFGVALLAMRIDSLIDAMSLVLGVVIAPLLAALLLGVFWNRATGAGAFSGLIAGAVAGLVHHGLALPRGEQRGIHGGSIAVVLNWPSSDLRLNMGTALLAFVVSLAVTAVVSAFTKARSEAELAELMWSSPHSETTNIVWWKRPEALGIAILVAAAAVCAVFV
jgi:solute:Na+ symporter, SSS family